MTPPTHCIDLDGDWRIVDESSSTTYPARVPGTVQTDLLAAGVINDPYRRDNAASIVWISQRTWRYTREFIVSPELAARQDLALRCDGIDTLGEVFINGRPVGSTDNMYLQYVWPLTGDHRLRAGVNRIEVVLRPPAPYIADRQARHKLRNWGTDHYQGIGQIRKAHYHFGWDWAPPIVPCGIWKSVSIIATAAPRVEHVSIQQDHTDAPAHVDLTIRVATAGTIAPGSLLRVVLRHNDDTIAVEAPVVPSGTTLQLRVPRPLLWWPRGLGDQPLYTLGVVLLSPDRTRLHYEERRIGLRNIRLIQEPDALGVCFRFEANGVPFFAKGGNWIPADCFPHRITRDRYRRLVAEAAEENCNMLRVWGGGLYESNDFMDACDELGVCVWHDFMFSCSTYPTADPDFLSSVRQEAVQAVRRLQHHASLVLWCGNNELEESGLVGDAPDQMPVAEYNAVFVDLLGKIVQEIHPDCPYIRSSGHSPGERRDRVDAWRLDAGDSHIWWQVTDLSTAADDIVKLITSADDTLKLHESVFNRIFPLYLGPSWERQRKLLPRFCSEIGRQSFPNPETCAEFADRGDLSPTSRVMEFHQQADNTSLVTHIARLFPLPSRFDDLAVLSQIVQGEFFRRFVELWRQDAACAGALFWCFNDCWPSVEWSQVDHSFRRKASFYIFRRFYADVLLSATDDPAATTFTAHVSNHGREPVTGRLQIRAFDTAGRVLLDAGVPVSVPAGTDAIAHRIDLASLPAVPPGHGPLWSMHLLTTAGQSHRGHLVPQPPKSLHLSPARFRCRVLSCEPSHARVAVETTHPALWCELRIKQRDNGRDLAYSDNFFHLVPGESHVVELFDRTGRLDPATLPELLHVRSLHDMIEP